MRSSAILFGVAALVAAVSGQTGMFSHSLIKKLTTRTRANPDPSHRHCY
jgi:hypothetical protein